MSHKKGFMLLEVIVSIVLITSGLLVVTLSFSTSKKLVMKSRELFNFSLLLRQKMSEVEQSGEISEAGQSGLIPEEDAAFLNGKPLSWDVRVKPVEDMDIREVTLELYFGQPGDGVAIETYLGQSKEI